METVLIPIILILTLALIGFARATFWFWFELRELRAVHQETCQKLETAQCRIKCKHLANDEILEADLIGSTFDSD